MAPRRALSFDVGLNRPLQGPPRKVEEAEAYRPDQDNGEDQSDHHGPQARPGPGHVLVKHQPQLTHVLSDLIVQDAALARPDHGDGIVRAASAHRRDDPVGHFHAALDQAVDDGEMGHAGLATRKLFRRQAV